MKQIKKPVTEQIDPEMLQRMSAILKALGHPVRLAIIEVLAEGEHNVSEIQKAIGESQPITSQHLRFMESRDVVTSRQDGVQVFYQLKNVFVIKILECIQTCGLDL